MWWVLWHLAEECPGLCLLACYVCAGQGLGEGLGFWGGEVCFGAFGTLIWVDTTNAVSEREREG